MLYTNSFIEHLRNCPKEKVLLVQNEKPIAAGTLLGESIALANFLSKNGVKEGDRVVLVVPPGPEFLKVMYACMMIRTVVSIIDPEMGRDNYEAKFRQFDPTHAFVDSRLILINEHPILRYILRKLKPSVPFFPKTQNCSIFTVGKRLPIFKKHIHIACKAVSDELNQTFKNGESTDDFLVTYTSGTLAEPKGVVHSYESLAETMTLLTNLLDKGGNERIATHLPHFMLLGINAGRPVYIWDNEFSAEEKLRFIEKNKITTIFGPPSDFTPMIHYLKEQSKSFPECLKNVYFGSAPVHAAFLSRFAEVSEGVRLTCLYGMTENLMVCYQDGHEKIKYDGRGDLVGTPFPGVKLSIQEDGEVGVDSNQKFKRYWHMSASNPVHLSGDLGEIDDQGRLVLIGRKKDMLIRGNFNIYPGLYETTINKIPGISEAVMIGLFDDHLADEKVFLVVESEKQLREADVMRMLKSGTYSIDKEALPDRIIFSKIPRFGRQNKIDRNKLRKQLELEFKK